MRSFEADSLVFFRTVVLLYSTFFDFGVFFAFWKSAIFSLHKRELCGKTVKWGDGAASDGSLFVYNILPDLHGILPIVKEAIFRYNVTSIYGKIIGNCER